ncbi:uncharacterized protein LOC144928764 [Branchiostoma floridae x Branchiostoma belcheri]
MAHMLLARENAAKVQSNLHKILHQARDLQVITMRGQHEGGMSYSHPGRLIREMHRSSIQLDNDFGAFMLWLKVSGLNEATYTHQYPWPTVAASPRSSIAASTPQDQVNIKCLHIQLSKISGAAAALIQQMDLFMQQPTQSGFNELFTLKASLVEAIGAVFLDWGACLELQEPHHPVPQLQDDSPAAAGNAAAAAPLQDQASNAAVSVAPTEIPVRS